MGYRSDPSFHRRLKRLAAARRRELRRLEPDVALVYARRSARVGAAQAGLILFAAAMLFMVIEWLMGDKPSALPVIALIAVWPLSLAVYVVVRLGSAEELREQLRDWIGLRSYPERDMARLQEQSTRQHAFELVSALQFRSLALPLVLLSLALPLTLHLPVSLIAQQPLEEFSGYMRLSTLVVGHAHVVLAVLSYRAVQSLCQRLDPYPNGWKVLGKAVIAAAVPGAVVLLPPLFTAATGALFVPGMFAWAKRTYLRERSLLA